jgi:predicted nucleotidyltransferase component of viral defense system
MPLDQIHKRSQEFSAALEFTSAETGFSARLIEKDYWCSLVLSELFAAGDTALVFKGGTLLSKAYAGFDRLSEDLDFTISTPEDSSRSVRSRRAKAIESQLNHAAQAMGLSWKDPWRGHNNSTQHTGRLAYPSILGASESILIDVSQREPTIRSAVEVGLKTLLLNPLFSEPALSSIRVMGLSLEEAYAEKVRAALTRQEPAIRDIYDLWQADQAGVLPAMSTGWLALAKGKCSEYSLASACSDARREAFRRGIETDLRPMLRSDLAGDFDFDAAWQVVVSIQSRLLSA